MPQAHDLSLEGRVAAVAADRGHHFSKPTLDRIVLVDGPRRRRRRPRRRVRPVPLSREAIKQATRDSEWKPKIQSWAPQGSWAHFDRSRYAALDRGHSRHLMRGRCAWARCSPQSPWVVTFLAEVDLRRRAERAPRDRRSPPPCSSRSRNARVVIVYRAGDRWV
jgi:hypothetical protein